MAIHPITPDPQDVQQEQKSNAPTHRNGSFIKFGILIFIFLFGSYFFSLWKNLGESDTRFIEFSYTPVPTKEYSLFHYPEDKFIGPEETIEELRKESKALFEQTGATMSAYLTDQAAEVLGSATELAKEKASESAATASRMLYDKTMQLIIKELFMKLSQEGRVELVDELCKDEPCREPTTVSSPGPTPSS